MEKTMDEERDRLKLELLKAQIKNDFSQFMKTEKEGCVLIFVSQDQLKLWTDRFSRVEKIVWGTMAIIVTGFLGALITIVYQSRKVILP
jgi:hypothetical protein